MRYGNPWMYERLTSEGLRMTQARKLIMNILAKTHKHLSAEEIYFIAHEVNPSIGVATVYRTLDLLTNMGVLQKFAFGDGKARYELITDASKEAHHHHLICTKCRKIIDYTDFVDEEKELIKKTEDILSRKHRFDIKNHIIHFYGLCENCKGGD
ncbi:MAG TPA: Fur family transcriptional regulator [bacterium]|nr:Fur family transcriptional regulator [bacterium]HPO51901.1 Fur family transcriptional regulator [bacterium]